MERKEGKSGWQYQLTQFFINRVACTMTPPDGPGAITGDIHLSKHGGWSCGGGKEKGKGNKKASDWAERRFRIE